MTSVPSPGFGVCVSVSVLIEIELGPYLAYAVSLS